MQMAFDQPGTSALVTAVLRRPFSDLLALIFGDGVEPVLALFAAGQNIGGVQLARRAATVGFATFAPEQIEGALEHGFGALEAAQGRGQSGVGAPESLAQA